MTPEQLPAAGSRTASEGAPQCLADLDTPAVVVDLDRLDHNLSAMAARVGELGVDLRPHIKTHKTVEITRKQLELGAVGVTVAKLGEVPPLRRAGATDVLVAYPVVGAAKLARLMQLVQEIRIRSCIDDLGAARQLGAVAAERGIVADVLVDVDVGLHRTGLGPAEAVELGVAADRLPGLSVAGVFAYGGYPGKDPDPGARRAWAQQEACIAREVADRLQQQGVGATTVSVAGSPTALYAAEVPGVTEVRPGTYVFGDANYARLGVNGYEDCALRVVATVVSRPSRQRAVLDAGSKVLTSDPSVGEHGYGLLPAYPEARLSRIWEEHVVVETGPHADGLTVGEQVAVIPNHVCPVVNLTDELVVARADTIEGRWAVVARGQVC